VDTQPPTITATGTTLTLGCNPTAAQIEAALGTATATDDCGDVTPTHADAAPVRNACSVSQTRTWNAVDGCNHAAAPVSRKVTWTEDTSGPAITGVVASTPVLWPPNHTLRDITIDYTVADDCGGDITSVLSVTSNEPIDGTGDGDTSPDWIRVDPHHLKLRAERAGTGSGRVYTVTVSATNACGLTSTTTVPVVVAHNITNPTSGNCFKVGSAVNFAGTFWDVAGKRHTAQWTFDNLAAAGTVVEPSGLKAGSATGKYTFTDAGIYKVTLNLTDQNGAKTWVNTAGDLEAIAVVYDPSAGYAIGGGWFTSPAGAYRAVPALGGKVSYGFTSKYFKNATNPKGETQFEFKQAGLEFNALNFDYLVISGAKAQFKGQGKLNGDGAYGFMLTVLDGQIKGGGGTDLVRVKIWNKTTGAVVYDTQPGASDTADPTTAVGSGSTVAITTTNVSATPAGQVANDPGTEAVLPRTFSFAAGRPNPFRSATELRYALPEQARVEMGVYDVRGARVRVLVDGVEEAGERSVRFDAGPLEAGVYFVRMQATSVSDPARQFTKMQKVLMLR